MKHSGFCLSFFIVLSSLIVFLCNEFPGYHPQGALCRCATVASTRRPCARVLGRWREVSNSASRPTVHGAVSFLADVSRPPPFIAASHGHIGALSVTSATAKTYR